MRKLLAVFGLFSLAACTVVAQAPAGKASVSHTTQAVNYRLRGDAVNISFHATDLMANATGEAKVEGKKSSVEIDAKFENLDDPTRFGLEYLTYVLWAVSPQGR